MAHHCYNLLFGWNFINDYNGKTQEFLDLAQIVHAVICEIYGSGVQIPRNDFVDYYGIAINNSELFKGMAQRKSFLPAALYPVMAEALAEYIIDMNSSPNNLINPPCP